MKSTTFALATLLASVAIAQPHRQHKHMAKHNKRYEEVVWVTDYEYVTETAKVTTTIWVPEGFVIPTETPSTSTSSTSSTQTYAANFFENASKAAKPSSSSTSIYVAPTPTPSSVAPPPSPPPPPTTTSVAPTPSPKPEPTSTYVAPPPVVEQPSYVAPVVDTPAPVYSQKPAAPTTPAAPVAAPTTPSTGGSTGGVCSAGSPCEGDITYYEAGLGACGETTDGSVDKVIALPVGMMGAQSNGNPYCGKTVTIKKGSKTTTATVVDKCMGCTGNSIDLSNAAFLELAEFDVGRTTATWWFN